MKIGISGATGLIGRALCKQLSEAGHQLRVFGRKRLDGVEFVAWDLMSETPDPSSFLGLDAFVHLAGEPIAGGRWSEGRKRLIRETRTVGTRSLVQSIQQCEDGPKVLVSASAVGFYGNRGDEVLTESNAPGEGYLPEVCRAWEAEALEARSGDVRVVLLRTGIVLSPQGGALQKMLPPFRAGVGGRIGSGRQYMSWIHLEDEAGLIEFALANSRVEGPLNAVSPNPVTNSTFVRVLGQVLRRPVLFPVPAVALRIALGEMGTRLLIEGQRVLPKIAVDLGFQFRHGELKSALEDLLA